jgi:hypothetical protein
METQETVKPAKRKVNWDKIRHEYLTRDVTLPMLVEKYGVNYMTLRNRCWKQKWVAKKAEVHKRMDEKLVAKTVNRITDKASQWAEDQWVRCTKYREKIDESMDQTGGPVDPQALDQLTKAEQRVDDMGRRALGMVEPRQVDITSGGMPLGAFQEAMRSVDAFLVGRRGCSKEIDVEALLADAPKLETSDS